MKNLIIIVLIISNFLAFAAIADSSIDELGKMISKAHDPDAGDDSRGYDYTHYHNYLEAIRELGRRGREKAVPYLIKSIKAQEKKIIDSRRGAQGRQRLAWLRAEAVKALGGIGTRNQQAWDVLYRVSIEGERPFGFNDGLNKHTNEIAQESLKAIQNNSFIRMPNYVHKRKSDIRLGTESEIRGKEEGSPKEIRSLKFDTDVDGLIKRIQYMVNIKQLKNLANKTKAFRMPSTRGQDTFFDSGTVSNRAIYRLQTLKYKDERATTALLDILSKYNYRGRSQNAYIARDLGGSAIKSRDVFNKFILLAKHKDEVVRASIIKQLAYACYQRSVNLGDSCEAEVQKVLQVAKNDKYKIVREAVQQALYQIVEEVHKGVKQGSRKSGKEIGMWERFKNLFTGGRKSSKSR